MKITKQQLKQIIEEELEAIRLNEASNLNENAPTAAGLPDPMSFQNNPDAVRDLLRLIPGAMSALTGRNTLGMMQMTLEDLYKLTKTI